ncbi:hypothetical protein M0R88_03680 [Halorussus gelatinilyticus]|uniref:Uncharacterized protein n=1 Tax=Halorussus gelatinilyticus TaxID=2937524 RepID=A0A8U0IKQ6_9EURY|nr:hypothetical protein [Halorussus gelatinilyticus]UPW01211.1 hypothetical protein M0R88_03680 [Halorussus gelatinilyticus]
MSAGVVTRWSRRFVAASAVFLVAWQVVALADASGALAGTVPAVPGRTQVTLAVYGFVLHTVFGKAYSLVPSYFDRSLALPRAPAVHLPLTVVGAVGLALAPLGGVPGLVGVLGALSWFAGVAVFAAALGWTLRTNPTGRETGTSDANAHRRGVDRLSNAFVPVVLAYLVVGSYATVAERSALGLPGFATLGPARTAHLLAAGTAALLIFAVGFRLFPRFLVASPPTPLVGVVLAAGAVGPAVLAAGLYRPPLFGVGAALEALAVVGFALAYAVLFARSERRRVGFYAVLAGTAAGVCGVALGVGFAVGHLAVAPELTATHFRLNVLGFLGLTIVGATYQFYPPTVGTFPGASDRTALASVVLLAGGLLAELGGALGGWKIAVLAGRASALVGALAFAGLVVGVFAER